MVSTVLTNAIEGNWTWRPIKVNLIWKISAKLWFQSNLEFTDWIERYIIYISQSVAWSTILYILSSYTVAFTGCLKKSRQTIWTHIYYTSGHICTLVRGNTVYVRSMQYIFSGKSKCPAGCMMILPFDQIIQSLILLIWQFPSPAPHLRDRKSVV